MGIGKLFWGAFVLISCMLGLLFPHGISDSAWSHMAEGTLLATRDGLAAHGTTWPSCAMAGLRKNRTHMQCCGLF